MIRNRKHAWILPFLLLAGCLTSGCHKFYRLHRAGYYQKLGTENAQQNGYHANEANRVIDFNDKNKEANQKHARDAQQTKSETLGELNKANKYNAKEPKKTKKRFLFYM